ncbi:MAG: translation initiation factor IF-2 [Candidatus Kapaibacterium sp.]
MAAMQSTKLFKLASQINIGKDTIVDFLQSKGFKIENKPTTALSDVMVDIVMEKFAKELRAVEKQREKIERHKIDNHKHSDIVSVDAVAEPVASHSDSTEQSAGSSQKSFQSESEIFNKTDKHDTSVGEVSEYVEAAPQSVVAAIEEVKPVAPAMQTQPFTAIEHTVEEVRPVEEVIIEKKSSTVISHPIAAKQDIVPKPEIIQHEETKVTEAPITNIVEVTPVPELTRERHTQSESVIQDITPAIEQSEVKDSVGQKLPENLSIAEEKTTQSLQVSSQVDTAIEPMPSPVAASSKDASGKASPTATGTPDGAPTEEQQLESEDGGGKRKKKRFTPVEYEAGNSNQLRGLTVLGKIDLSKGGSNSQQNDGRKTRKDGGKIGDRKDDRRDRDKKSDRRPDQRDARPGDRNKTGRSSDAVAAGTSKTRENPVIRSQSDDKPVTSPQLSPAELELVKSKHKFGKRGVGVETIASKIGVASKQDDKKKKVKGKKSIREVITEEEVERAIRETRQGMDESSTISQRSKLRQKRKLEREEKEQRRQEELDIEDTILRLTEFVSTSDLANLMRVTTSEVIMKCMKLGLMVTINQRLDKDTITLIADDYGFTVEFIDEQHVSNIEDDEDSEESLIPRPPIVTIMGHVDHGKTSLLDYIRKANVVAGEAGGITQHIGAYHVTLQNGKEIGFLDTPGHEAFTAMRARGAQVTDIVVLVVAADDQVMPQTIEAISHANAANVPIVVALNKIDRAEANPDKIKQQLADHGVLVEDWGGKFQCVHVSAKQGLNIDVLLEKILLEAEILELKANPDRQARGTVIEAHLDKGKGILATVLVQKGTLRVGDPFVVGIHSGRVRAMFDERGNRVQSAGPSIPVQLSGFDGLPAAGDIFVAMEEESEAKTISARRQLQAREQQFKQVRHTTLDDISAQIKQGGTKELKLIIKGDVGGSVEALSDSLHKLSRDEVKVNIILKGVGSISEGDIMLAAASDAVVIGFNTAVSSGARRSAETEGVDVRLYSIIYDCINEVQLALEGLLSPEIKEEITSTVEVRQIFKISKLGVIAGCYVQSGKITRNDKVRVLRDGFAVFKGGLQSLKRIKDDVREVDTGFECGIAMQGFNDFEIGDIIEGYKITEVKRKLT